VPELPEMQALSERLAQVMVGQTFAGAQPIQFAGLKTYAVAPESLAGKTITDVSRIGKYVVMTFDSGERMLLHLSQAGRLDIESPAKITRPKQGVVRWTLGDGTGILVKEFGTERKAGWWVLAEGDDGPLVKLGPDVDSPEGEAFLLESGDARRVHTILRDQRTIAGVGRGYSDDALHEAGISPFATLAGLDRPTRERLVGALRKVLADGLEEERKRKGGLPTKVGDHWVVHGRYGQPCPRCGTGLRRVSYESHEVAYCPPCQTGGKILADRRLSRLVK
jgi:formamidopyrimidine-DNA glycosylase